MIARVVPGILASALLAVASAEELRFSLTGQAVPLDAPNTAPVPFSVLFDVDSSSGAQSFTYGGNDALQLFSVAGVDVTNFSASVNGLLLLSAANLSGKFWGNALAGDPAPAATSFDAGLELPPFDGGDFHWTFMPAPDVPPGSADPLGTILRQPDLPGSVGELNQRWGLDHFTVNVAAVPEPGVLALLLLGLLGLGVVAWKTRRAS